jgi:hypothetical protein
VGLLTRKTLYYSWIVGGTPLSIPTKLNDCANEFAMGKSSSQVVLDLFSDEWPSGFPPLAKAEAKPELASLFEDSRILVLKKNLGPVAGQAVLEFGPLEAADTFMLHQLGAAKTISVEANLCCFRLGRWFV